MYQKRSYKVVGGKLRKRWDSHFEDGWVASKAEALSGVAPEEPKPKAKSKGSKKPVEIPDNRDYDTWTGPQLRAALKQRSGKGPRPGTTNAQVVEQLRALDG